MASKIRVTITAGPDKSALFVSLIHGNRHGRVSVTFDIHHDCGDEGLFTANIDRVGREDESGHSWNISGLLTGNIGDCHVNHASFEGFYSTSLRRGWIEIPRDRLIVP